MRKDTRLERRARSRLSLCYGALPTIHFWAKKGLAGLLTRTCAQTASQGEAMETRLPSPHNSETTKSPAGIGEQVVAGSVVEVSVVMPCLNEADTIGTCIEKAQRAIREHNISAEIVVADNGSTDGSVGIASSMGVRVVRVESRGYGSALMGGIAAARGKYVIMGDADDSYDFGTIPKFVAKLREGFDLVQGCRLPSGGGFVLPGAMPFLHRWIGNPVLSAAARGMFSVPVQDIYCGLRGFTRRFYEGLDQRCTGMEFATEMIIKATLLKARIAEIPITLHPDGRRLHPPHLRTVRDGWRTVRVFLIYSPRWLFLFPGVVLGMLGFLSYALAMPGISLMGVRFDAHTLLVGSLFVLMSYQCILFGIFAKTFAIAEGLLPPDRVMSLVFRFLTLERGLIIGFAALLLGVGLLLTAVNEWRVVSFGQLDYARTMRLVVPGATLTALGFETIWSSFFGSMLGMHRR